MVAALTDGPCCHQFAQGVVVQVWEPCDGTVSGGPFLHHHGRQGGFQCLNAIQWGAHGGVGQPLTLHTFHEGEELLGCITVLESRLHLVHVHPRLPDASMGMQVCLSCGFCLDEPARDLAEEAVRVGLLGVTQLPASKDVQEGGNEGSEEFCASLWVFCQQLASLVRCGHAQGVGLSIGEGGTSIWLAIVIEGIAASKDLEHKGRVDGAGAEGNGHGAWPKSQPAARHLSAAQTAECVGRSHHI